MHIHGHGVFEFRKCSSTRAVSNREWGDGGANPPPDGRVHVRMRSWHRYVSYTWECAYTYDAPGLLGWGARKAPGRELGRWRGRGNDPAHAHEGALAIEA